MKAIQVPSEANYDCTNPNCLNQGHQKLFYTINYKRKTLLGSASLLSVIRAFQPGLLIAGIAQIAIITLIVRYVLNCYPTKGQEKDETVQLNYALNEDTLIALNGLRAIVIENNLKTLSEIDLIVDYEVRKILFSLKDKLRWLKECSPINNYVEEHFLNASPFKGPQLKVLEEGLHIAQIEETT